MKIFENFSRIQHSETENFKTVKICGSVSWQPDIASTFIDILSSLGNISQRDNFVFLLEKIEDHDTLSIMCNDESSIDNMNNWLLADEQSISFITTINKKIDNEMLSIYSIDKFIDFLNEVDIFHIISWFSDNISVACSRLNFEVFDEVDTFNTHSIMFHGYSSKHENNEPINRDNNLNIFKSSAKFSGLNINVIPEDFKLIKQSKFKSLNDLFEKVQVLLSIIFISNNSYVKDNILYCDISNGVSAVTIQLDSNNMSINKVLIYKIYLWIYGTEHAFDKLSITRNILLSAYSQIHKSIDINENIWSVIQSNFQIYMKNNFENYLESKEKISNALMEISNKSFAIADEIGQSLKKGASVVLVSFFSGVVIKGLKDHGIDLFSGIYLYIVISAIACSYIWFEALACMSRNRLWALTKHTYKILYNTYGEIIYKKEIKYNVKVANKLGKSHLNKVIKSTRKTAIIMIVPVSLFFIIGYFCINY